MDKRHGGSKRPPNPTNKKNPKTPIDGVVNKPKKTPPSNQSAKKSLNLNAYRNKRNTYIDNATDQTPVATPRSSRRPEGNKHLISVSATIVLVIMLIATVAYFIEGMVAVASAKQIPTITVERGSIDSPTELDSIIIRDEHVYPSSKDGELVFGYNNLDRVKKGDLICTVQDTAAVEAASQELEAVDEDILALQDKREDITVFSPEVQKTNEQIQTIVDHNIQNFIGSDVSSVYNVKQDIERILTLRNQMLLSDNSGSVSEMSGEKERLETQLNSNLTPIITENSGILCYTVDGQEELLTFDNMNELTPEQTRMTVDYSGIIVDKQVKANEPAFKIVESNEWYVATYAPNELIFDWEVGQERSIYIRKNNETEFSPAMVTVEKIVPNGDESLLLLKNTNSMSDYLDARDVTIKLTNDGYNGYKIPFDAVVDKTMFTIPLEYVDNIDSKPTVTVRGTEADEKISIVIDSVDDTSAYVFQDVNGINVGDVLVNPNDKSKTFTVKDVTNVTGVYLLNYGFANFVEVTLSNDVPDSNGYIVLDETINTGLNAGDKIITDTQNIVDGQKLQ